MASAAAGHPGGLITQAATATFFLLLVISFVDAIGGYTITMRASQRNILVDQVDAVHRAV